MRQERNRVRAVLLYLGDSNEGRETESGPGVRVSRPVVAQEPDERGRREVRTDSPGVEGQRGRDRGEDVEGDGAPPHRTEGDVRPRGDHRAIPHSGCTSPDVHPHLREEQNHARRQVSGVHHSERLRSRHDAKPRRCPSAGLWAGEIGGCPGSHRTASGPSSHRGRHNPADKAVGRGNTHVPRRPRGRRLAAGQGTRLEEGGLHHHIPDTIRTSRRFAGGDGVLVWCSLL